MLILFEGHDNSGKTTIAKALAEEIGFEYFRHNRPTHYFNKSRNRDFVYAEGLFFCDFLSQVNLNLIIDRHIPSEWVYCHQYKRFVNPAFIIKVDNLLGELGVLSVLCEKDLHAMEGFIDEYVKLEEIESIKNLYRQYYSSSSMKHLLLNTTSMNLDSQLYEIIKFIKGE